MNTPKYKPDPLEFRAAPTAPDLHNEYVENVSRGFRGCCPACGKGRMFRA